MTRLLASVSIAAMMIAATPAFADMKQGGEMTVTFKDDLITLDPAIGYDWKNWSVIKSVFDGLMDYKPGTTELVPDLAESFDVLEISINRREPHVCDFVYVPKTIHNQLSDFCSGQFPVGRIRQLCLDLVHEFGQLSHRHRPLFAGLEQPFENLLAVELFTPSVSLYNYVGNFVAALVSGESPFALQAFPPSTDDVAFFALARIDDAVFTMTAEGANHRPETALTFNF